MVPLRELLREAKDEATFVAKHKVPALIIEPHGGAGAARPPTASPAAFELGGTEVLSPAVVQRELARSPSFLTPGAQVAWLEKSDRNPFANLITIGRARTNDIVIEHPGISKVHATFSQVGEQWFVQDGKSRNGTFVNGVRLDTGGKAKVGDGDGVSLGGEVACRLLTAASLWTFLSVLPRTGGAG